MLSLCKGQVAHALLTRPPLRYTRNLPESFIQRISPLDLHVLGTPPAFILSQDQTLKFIILNSGFTLTYIDVLPSGFTSIKSMLSQVVYPVLLYSYLLTYPKYMNRTRHSCRQNSKEF